MPKVRLDAIGVTARDTAKSVAFYELLGFTFGPADSPDHIEATTETGGVRLMIDSHKLATDLLGEAPRPSNHSHFGLLCESPAEVDRLADAVAAAGFTVAQPAWDAFWGQRYAIVADPDGYRIDLFARLD